MKLRLTIARLSIALVAMCILFVPTSASAGIIVTEGKLSHCGLRADSIQTMIFLGLWPDDLPECGETDRGDDGSDHDDDADSSANDYEDEEDLDLDDEELGDLDTTPEGYECSDVAGGIEFCEPEDEEGDDSDSESDSDSEDGDEFGQGAAPGFAQGGVWHGASASGATAESEGLNEDLEVGCQAGGKPADSLPAALVVLLGLVATIKRRYSA